MRNDNLNFSGRTLRTGEGESINLDYPVIDAFQLGDRIIVLLDPDSYGSNFGQFRNLLALTVDGERLWTAELPTTMSNDTYYRISSRCPLIADTLSSYACEIDQSSGKIRNKTFFK